MDHFSQLMDAAVAGDHRQIAWLLEHTDTDPRQHASAALRAAAAQGHSACVQLLIKHSNPYDRKSEALGVAAANGFTECVKLLVPVSDPRANSYKSLIDALYNGHTECVKLLVLHADLNKVYGVMFDHLKQGILPRPQVHIELENARQAAEIERHLPVKGPSMGRKI